MPVSVMGEAGKSLKIFVNLDIAGRFLVLGKKKFIEQNAQFRRKYLFPSVSMHLILKWVYTFTEEKGDCVRSPRFVQHIHFRCVMPHL